MSIGPRMHRLHLLQCDMTPPQCILNHINADTFKYKQPIQELIKDLVIQILTTNIYF